MDTQSTIILAACGIFAVILMVLALGGLIMYRMLRFNVVNALMGWFMRGDDKETPVDPYASQQIRHRADELRAKAEALDFDQAVAQYQRTQPQDVQITGAPQVAPNPPLEERPISTSSPIGGRYRRVSGADGSSTSEIPDPPSGFTRVPDVQPLPPSPNVRPLRKPRREVNPDEIFGGVLDEDGDGTIDF